MAKKSEQSVQGQVEINAPGSQEGTRLVISNCPPNLHQDPKKIHQLLDLLEMPKGTEVKVTINASSVIVR